MWKTDFKLTSFRNTSQVYTQTKHEYAQMATNDALHYNYTNVIFYMLMNIGKFHIQNLPFLEFSHSLVFWGWRTNSNPFCTYIQAFNDSSVNNIKMYFTTYHVTKYYWKQHFIRNPNKWNNMHKFNYPG